MSSTEFRIHPVANDERAGVANKLSQRWNAAGDDARLDAFFRAPFNAPGFATGVLHAYATDADRR